MNIGVLGGTFDPIHIGHLILAEEARVKLELNEVNFVPAGYPWLKIDRAITPAIHRVEMVRLAIAANPCFKLCTIEVGKMGPSYTVDTILMLQEQLGTQANLFFILGHDALTDLSLWKEPGKLIQMCRLAVAPRLSSLNSESLERSIPGLSARIIPLDMPLIEISSTEIRRRLAEGLSVRYLVPDSVEKYMTEHKLYRI